MVYFNKFKNFTHAFLVLNEWIKSVFTPVSPLRLNHLSESAVLDGLADGTLNEKNIPGLFGPKVSEMPQISISLGILKLLAGLDPGPDAIKPVVLRSLKDQVAPILQIIFQQSLTFRLEEGYRYTCL